MIRLISQALSISALESLLDHKVSRIDALEMGELQLVEPESLDCYILNKINNLKLTIGQTFVIQS